MTFEEVLPALKAGKKPSGPLVGAAVKNIFVVKDDTLNGEKINPYLMIKTKEEPSLSQFMPTSCDVLATDWELVD